MLHMDRNKYYGGDSASLSPLEDVRVCVCLCLCVCVCDCVCVCVCNCVSERDCVHVCTQSLSL